MFTNFLPAMFVTESFEIHPDFGVTLEQVFQIIKDQDPLGQFYISPTITPITGPAILCSNPYATKWVKQNPIFFSAEETYLHFNKSEEAIYLLRETLRSIKTETPLSPVRGFGPSYNLDTYTATITRLSVERLEHALLNSHIETLDTYLTSDFLQQLGPYCLKRMYKWLCSQPKAIPHISKNLSHADWDVLSENPEAIDLLLQYPENINWAGLCKNTHPEAISLLRDSPNKICWSNLCMNPCEEAVDLLLENREHLHPFCLSNNRNSRAVALLRHDMERIDWVALSKNSCDEAVSLLEENPLKVHWNVLCRWACTSRQLSLLRQRLPHLTPKDWMLVCQNPSNQALQLLRENPHQIHWNWCLRKHNVFEVTTTYDYEGIRQSRRDLHEEYHAWAGHPVRLQQKWKDWGMEEFGIALGFGEEEAFCTR